VWALRPSPTVCGSVTDRWRVPPPTEVLFSVGVGGADAGGGEEGRELPSGASKSSALGSMVDIMFLASVYCVVDGAAAADEMSGYDDSMLDSWLLDLNRQMQDGSKFEHEFCTSRPAKCTGIRFRFDLSKSPEHPELPRLPIFTI
jgi:hypothetical protein